MIKWDNAFNKFGLKMNKSQTVLRRRQEKVCIQIRDEVLNQVQKLKYLGSKVADNGLIDIEISRRLSRFLQNVGFLYRLLKDKTVPRKANKIILTGMLRPILTYGAESWTINIRNMFKLVAADMRVVRLIHGVRIMEKFRNKDLGQKRKATPNSTGYTV